ncbi:MAG: response regulator transcription factor [Calditrichaeota bacterium]|nr:response regulator transcription factor [Calditrichota bacterium]MCB9277271.1 response regulator transcription factor [Lewinellaceae bacterium]
MRTTILLVEDHHLVRQGIHALLKALPEMEVVGEAADGRTALQLAGECRPDVVIMDIGIPKLNGIDATRHIKDRNPRIKVLALSMDSDPLVVRQMLLAGADGYLLKECMADELAAAIRALREGKKFLSADISGVVVDDYLDALSGRRMMPEEKLTLREREVLQLLAEEHSIKEIAAMLNISDRTVDSHKRKAMEKLGIYTLVGLIKYAIRNKLTTLG